MTADWSGRCGAMDGDVCCRPAPPVSWSAGLWLWRGDEASGCPGAWRDGPCLPLSRPSAFLCHLCVAFAFRSVFPFIIIVTVWFVLSFYLSFSAGEKNRPGQSEDFRWDVPRHVSWKGAVHAGDPESAERVWSGPRDWPGAALCPSGVPL